MPTEVIRPKFDVVRGWPHGSAYDRTFERVQDGAAAPLKVRQGTFVTLNAAGAATPVTVLTAPTAFPVWCVIEGNDPSDSYAGDYLNKVVAIKGAYELLLSSSMYVAGAYAPGVQVSFLAGKVKVADGTNVGVSGYVTAYDSAAGELRVAFNL